MAKLRHIAVATKDPENTSEFYKKHFEMEVAGRIENDLAHGYYLTDGVVCLAILKFKIPNSNRSWDSENYTGIHHFGFIVEDMEKAAGALEADGSELAAYRYEGRGADTVFYEFKYTAPDDVVLDISQRGWVGANGDV
ncbi:MAG: VOC family protein [Nitrospinota bacterium]|jgi:methylmalonyl-CoA/ethylmalonyl-CoA epimerase|nr:VOC family protein [Nitrospinota bacterium]